MKDKKHLPSSRMLLATVLIITAFSSTLLISIFTNKGDDFWVVDKLLTPGHVIIESDLVMAHLNLDTSAEIYIKKNFNPFGMVVTRAMNKDEVLAHSDLTSTKNAMSTSAIPLSIRSVDFSPDLMLGEAVDIYWVSDSRNGEEVIDPILVLGGVTLLNFEDSETNFGGDIAITVAVEQTQVLRMLSATTQGRLVVVGSHV